jgi:hypothetical protein
MNVLKMAHIESQEIRYGSVCTIPTLSREMDDEIKSVIGDNLKKLSFLYGPHDGYAPKSYYEQLKGEYSKIM